MPTVIESALNQPFDAAIEFFRKKLQLGTTSWLDIWEEAHSEAFVVSGAMQKDLLADLYAAIDKAIKDGTTLSDFRKSFADTVARNGWEYYGTMAWRTALIYNTNLSMAYHTGHYQAMLDPEVLDARPYWRYVESSSRRQRPEHLRWVGTVLPATDPWWNTHAPPNGWNCRCGVVSMSAREVEILGNKYPDVIKTLAPPIRYYDWKNPKTGEIIKVPDGIDPGWAYHPGLKRR